MKTLLLSAIAILAVGCGQRSPYDVTAEQVKSRGPGLRAGGELDLDHLPPGAVKSVKTFKKGDRLPDGSIADGDRKMVEVKIEGPGPNGGQTQDTVRQIRREGKP